MLAGTVTYGNQDRCEESDSGRGDVRQQEASGKEM